jgi:hypothetical protein
MKLFVILFFALGQACEVDQCQDEECPDEVDCNCNHTMFLMSKSRDEYYTCKYCDVDTANNACPGNGEYNYHRTKLEENENGDLKCVLCGGTSNEPQSIADFGTDDMSILKIPIMKNNIIGYKNNWHITYKVNCTPGDVAFLTFEFLDTRGRDCDGSCWDYITITSGAFGPVRICDPAEPGPKLVKTLDTDGSYTLIFRSGECNHDGKKWVKKMRNNDCQNYHRGFELHTICGQPSSPPAGFQGRRKRYSVTGEETMNAECGIEKSSTSYGSLFPDVYTSDLLMAKDLARFHEQWQRMSEQPGAELIIEYVLYNQTVNYFDSTILIMKSNETVAKYDHVKFMKTFDSNGKTKYYIGGDTRRKPDPLVGPGPLVIVCNCAFFQMFEIDPRGLVPNSTEQNELKIMYTPFLNLSSAYYDLYSYGIGSGAGINGSGIGDEVDIRPDPANPSSRTSFTKDERNAVIAAHKNTAVCNPFLRAQSNTTLDYFSRVNAILVECLGDYLSCSLRDVGHFIAELTCSSRCAILPGNTTCQINDGSKKLCDPFTGAVEFSLSVIQADLTVHDDLTVNTTNIYNHSTKVVLRLQS